ncbi:MAG TPA: efflux RND transporter periplasmic adaptor subunit [Rhizomicrobium sp.]|jgi:multidrug efflux system membrane fusion protein|nr:efflux RND transporter periplasmic adaptor subunit [Rhizomicrobium sp.]
MSKAPSEAADNSTRDGGGWEYLTGAQRSGWGARLRQNARFVWVAVGVLLVLLLIWFLRQNDGTGQRSRRVEFGGPTPVGVAKAAQGDMSVTLNALGTVTPIATVTVRPQVSGAIIKFNFTEGQAVKAGEVLAEIDPRPYQAAYDSAKGALDRDRAALANAVIDLHRYQALAATNAISGQLVATQAALVRQDEGTVKLDEGNVAAAAVNLKYCTIASPVTGRAGIRQMDLGNLVQAGQTNGIVVVTQMQPMSVVFSLPEDNVDQIQNQLRNGATLTATAFDRNQTKVIATGKLTALDSAIDPTTGTVKLRAQFDNSDTALFPNQFVNVRLLVNTLHDQTLLPVAAIQRGSEGTYVFVVGPDKTVSMRAVTLGPTDSIRVAITKGLRPGDTVVVDGADRLKDGAEVTIPKPVGTISKPSAGAGVAGAGHAGGHRGRFAAAMRQYCAADMKNFCPKATPGTPEARQCFRDNMASFSNGCRNALAKLRQGMSRGGFGFGGGGG